MRKWSPKLDETPKGPNVHSCGFSHYPLDRCNCVLQARVANLNDASPTETIERSRTEDPATGKQRVEYGSQGCGEGDVCVTAVQIVSALGCERSSELAAPKVGRDGGNGLSAGVCCKTPERQLLVCRPVLVILGGNVIGNGAAIN